MSLSDRKVQIGVVVVVLLVGVGIAWSVLKPESGALEAVAAVEPRPVAAGPNLSVEALREADPIDVWKLFRRKDLSEEQQEELMANAREAQMLEINERMNRYFSAGVEGREAILDEQIDEWVEMQERMTDYLDEEPLSEEEESSLRERWAKMQAPSREERKDHFETGKSEDRARMMAYLTAAYSRMQVRGVTMRTRPGQRTSGSDSDSGDKSSRRRRNR